MRSLPGLSPMSPPLHRLLISRLCRSYSLSLVITQPPERNRPRKATVPNSTSSGALGLVSRAVSPRSTSARGAGATCCLRRAAMVFASPRRISISTISVVVPATVLEEGLITRASRAARRVRLACARRRAVHHGAGNRRRRCSSSPAASTEPSCTASTQLNSRCSRRVTPRRRSRSTRSRCRTAITQTVMAASFSDETVQAAPVLTGVLPPGGGGPAFTLAATDRHRLAVKTIDITVHGTPPVHVGDRPVAASFGCRRSRGESEPSDGGHRVCARSQPGVLHAWSRTWRYRRV